MQDPSDILDPIMDEATRTLKEMKNTKDLAQRKVQSATLLNLCRSAGVFFDLMSDAMMSGDLPDFSDDEIA